MNPLGFSLLTDENIHPEVITFLRQQSYTVQTSREAGLNGQSDLVILRYAYNARQVVLTHDSDFGTLVFMQEEPLIGIIYLRPGHIRPEFTIETLKTIAAHPFNLQSSFIVVAERSGQTVRIRIRQL